MNQLEKIVSKLNLLPERVRPAALSAFFGRTVKGRYPRGNADAEPMYRDP